ncbi:unnamed protein product, partial [Prorocentrum cordatum]
PPWLRHIQRLALYLVAPRGPVIMPSDETKSAALLAARAIAGAQRCVVFSGAGASADSGIGTFRGANGAWSGLTGTLALLWGGTPVGWRWTPGLVWARFVRDFYGPIAAAEPHDGLRALAELQGRAFGAVSSCSS